MANNLKIVFPDGNLTTLQTSQCNCPNMLNVDISNLIIGRKYTVSITNLNSTQHRVFPESFSFTADQTAKRLTYYYQFINNVSTLAILGSDSTTVIGV